MLVWRGSGIFVVVLTVVAYLLAVQAGEHFLGSPLPAANRAAVELLGMLIAAALVVGLHIAIDRTSEPRTVVDKATGQEIALQAKHDLFFIPIKFSPYILAALGVWFFFQH